MHFRNLQGYTWARVYNNDTRYTDMADPADTPAADPPAAPQATPAPLLPRTPAWTAGAEQVESALVLNHRDIPHTPELTVESIVEDQNINNDSVRMTCTYRNREPLASHSILFNNHMLFCISALEILAIKFRTGGIL